MAAKNDFDREVPIFVRFTDRSRDGHEGRIVPFSLRAAFWRGVSRVLSSRTFLEPTPARRRRTTIDDVIALRGDWVAIGSDLRAALERAEREHSIRTDKTAAR